MADALCRLATGGGYAIRRLYTDADEALFEAQRPVLLTGIEELPLRGDLIDRALMLTLPPCPRISGGVSTTSGGSLRSCAHASWVRSTRSSAGRSPVSPHRLSGLLRRIAPDLRAAGIVIEFDRAPNKLRTRLIRISARLP
jgi:hypothetical protein